MNPHCFTVQLQSDAVEFDKFQRTINAFYNANDAQQLRVQIEQIRVNLCVICATTAASGQESIWHRSQILDFDLAGRTTHLFHVDLGLWEEYVPIDRLRHLIEPFHNQMVFSLTCRLAHVNPVHDSLVWSDDATHQLRSILEQYIAQIELLSRHPNECLEANLFVNDAGHEVNLGDYLISTANAQPMENTRRIEDPVEQTTIQVRDVQIGSILER